MRKSCTAVAIALCLMMFGCNNGGSSNSNASKRKVKITDVEAGTGRVAEKDDFVLVLYRGTFPKDGKQFDTNMDDPESQMPFGFGVSAGGGAIQGFADGVEGMKEGGTRKIEVPWELAYGADGDGNKIGPKTDLNFDLKLLYVLKKSERGVYDYNDDKVGTGAEAVDGSTVEVHYKGTYLTGKVWDDSRERGKTVTFTLDKESRAIPGIVAGVKGMKVGGKRTLVLPPDLVFGPYGNANIQGNQPVRVVVDLISVNGK